MAAIDRPHSPRHWARAASALLGVIAVATTFAAGTASAVPADTVLDTIEVGGGPVGVAITPDGAYAYVANFWDESVSVISTSSNRVVGTVPVGGSPVGVAITPDGTRAYVTLSDAGGVAVIKTADHTAVEAIGGGSPPQGVGRIDVGSGPEGLAITPDGEHVYVANRGSDDVSVIETARNVVVDTVAVGDEPHGVAITPSGDKVYVTNVTSATVSVIGASPASSVADVIAVWELPGGVAISPDGTRAYVTHDTGALTTIDVGNNTVLSRIEVGLWPRALAIAPGGAHAYFVDQDSNKVWIADLATGQVSGSIGVNTPSGVAITPDGTRGYVSSFGTGTVAVIGVEPPAAGSLASLGAFGSLGTMFGA